MSDISERLGTMRVRGAHIPPLSISPGYRLLVAFGALAALLFPLAYIALIALTGWGIYSFAARLSPLGLCLVLLAGTLLILSFAKPLIARSVPLPRTHALDARQEPLLFAFVREIASAGAMPEPSGISVDCSVNAYCSFTGGITGLFRSEFDLVIGLPLAAGLRLGQFAGILAHELGHASLARTRCSIRLLWSVGAWFSRVVDQRDEIDERILTWLAAPGRETRFAARLTQLFVLPGRGVLLLLKIAESAAVSMILRRIELETSRCQVRVAGSDGFISAVSELNLLSLAAQRAVIELSRMKRQGQLVDNYPGLITSIRDSYSEGFARRMLTRLESGKAGFLASHPADRDRIALARAEARPGIVTADLPASELFADFDAVCREVTLEFYRQEFGLTPEACELVPAPQPRS